MRVAAAVMSLLVRPSASCTTVVVNATKEDAVAIGRTMELGIPLSIKETNTLWALVTTPRGATLGQGISLPYGFAQGVVRPADTEEKILNLELQSLILFCQTWQHLSQFSIFHILK